MAEAAGAEGALRGCGLRRTKLRMEDWLSIRGWVLCHRVAAVDRYQSSQDAAMRRMAARLRATSDSVVAHDDTLMRIAV